MSIRHNSIQSSLETCSLLSKKKKKNKVLNEPGLHVKSLAVYRHKLLPIANFPCNYRFGSILEFTDYPEQHKPELSKCQKREFPRLDSIEEFRVRETERETDTENKM